MFYSVLIVIGKERVIDNSDHDNLNNALIKHHYQNGTNGWRLSLKANLGNAFWLSICGTDFGNFGMQKRHALGKNK